MSNQNSNSTKSHKIIFSICILIIACVCALAFFAFKGNNTLPFMNRSASASDDLNSQPYGVFLGISNKDMDRLIPYQTVVIEPEEFTADDIQQLHADGKFVYGYLSIGTLENYRSYYDQFKNSALDIYEDWPDEYWMDVADAEWQSFTVDDLGQKYADMGFDGFFLDNTDVYYHYPTEEIYDGLLTIISGLKENYGISIMINGGDTFVSQYLRNLALSKSEENHDAIYSSQQLFDKEELLIDAVNQESVFTAYDFESKEYKNQTTEDTEYFEDYLSRIFQNGISVYLLEYGASEGQKEVIASYCKEHRYTVYFADSIELK